MKLFLIYLSLMMFANEDKIEKQGVLLNVSCSGFGTRCTGTSSFDKLNYTFCMMEDGIRLRLEIKQAELEKNKYLLRLLSQSNKIKLEETMSLPDEVIRKLSLTDKYCIKPGLYPVEKRGDVYRIILLD